MQVLLRIANGKSNVRKVRLQSDTVIGRSPECQLKVASNQISRRHCQIVIRDTLVAIKDLGSANGTFVNGRKVPAEIEIPLTPGTRVMLGPLHFTVEYELPGMGEPTPVQTDEDIETGTLALDTVDSEVEMPGQEVTMDTIQQPSPFRDQIQIPQFAPPPQTGAPEPQPARIANPVAPAQPAPQPAAANVVAAAWQSPMSVTPAPGLGDTHLQSPPVPAVPVAPIVPVQTATPPVAAVVKTAAPATPAAAPPEFFPGVDSSEETSEQEEGFNFGIFAASGSGVLVESAVELPRFDQPALTPPASPAKPEKPAKKGLFQMLGWGKKKAPSQAPEPAPAPAASEPAAEEPALIAPVAAAPHPEAPAEGGLSFEFPAEEEAADASEGSDDDEALKNFFNNFK